MRHFKYTKIDFQILLNQIKMQFGAFRKIQFSVTESYKIQKQVQIFVWIMAPKW